MKSAEEEVNLKRIILQYFLLLHFILFLYSMATL